MSGIPRPVALHKPNDKVCISKNRSGEDLAEYELVQALMLGAHTLYEGGNRNILVVRARKYVRKAASRDAHPDLGECTRRAADAGYPGTYKMWLPTWACKCVLLVER